MKQIYKTVHVDEEGRYFFVTEEDTKYVVDQQSYLLIYIIELLNKLVSYEEEKEIPNLNNADGGEEYGQTEM